jgi:WD40 repeat protein/serine/threonine protein kinase
MTLQRCAPADEPGTTQRCKPAPHGARMAAGAGDHGPGRAPVAWDAQPGEAHGGASTADLRDVDTLGRTIRESMRGFESTESAAQEARAAALALPGADGKIGQYELIRPLGRGGMGTVYLARDLRLGRRVAIKLLTGHARQGNARFLAETRATARCNHENIVGIHDVGEHDGRPYMVLEYVEGQTLSAWLDERTRLEAGPDAGLTGAAERLAPGAGARVERRAGRAPLAPGLAVETMLPVVRALACAHELGIVHRDLKPTNIMVTGAGAIKVLDFGIAKLMEPRGRDGEPWQDDLNTEPGVILGTPPYMPPEQLAGGDVDHRADIWAVGIMLFEMVVGVHPVLVAAGVEVASPLALRCLLSTSNAALAMPSAAALRPDLGPLAGIIDRCLIKDRNHRTGSARALLAELEAVASGRGPAALDRDQSPFAGLAPFREADAGRFFGRAREIAALVARLHEQPLVTVAGPSGAGKSSLVRAGVIPALERAGEGWTALIVRPGRRPLAALADALASLPRDSTTWGPVPDLAPGPAAAAGDAGGAPAAAAGAAAALVARLAAEPGYLGGELRAWARARLRRPVIFVDQCEELYTLGASAAERAAFLACLDAVADDAASPLRVILAVRADFLDRMTENRHFLEVVNRGLMFLSPLDRDGLREALVRPLEACEHRLERPDMIERVLDELAATRGALPLLQFTAAELWARRDRARRLLTEASLRALGGVAGALAGHADAVLADMPGRELKLARGVFLRLVTPERTRALVTLGELRQASRDRAAMDRVLGQLIAARLLVVEGSTGGTVGSDEDDAVVEIVHESLIDAWPLLGRWLSENEEDALFLARLRGAALDWQRRGRDPGLLWTGQAAHDARTWRRRYAGVLAPGEARFLDAVFAALDRRSRLRRRLVGGALAGTTAVAIAMAWLAWGENRASVLARQAAARAEQEAERAAREAARAEHMAVLARDATLMAAVRALPDDPTTQLALLRELERKAAPPPGAVQEAKRLVHAPVARAILSVHEHGVTSAAFSPDGARIVSASHDGTVRVWRVGDGRAPLVLRGHEAGVRAAVFSPDGGRIASASYDGTVRVWAADGSGAPQVLRGHEGWVWSVAFSPDGGRIASASYDGTVRVWDARGGQALQVLRGHGAAVMGVAFSPDGARVASSSKDGTVRVWRADGEGRPRVLRGHQGWVESVAFGPDGAAVASASHDGTVRVWRVDGRGAPVVLRGHDGHVSDVAFSPDGGRVASSGRDRTVRVWNADGSGEPVVLRGHDGAVPSVAFRPDGAQVVSASLDETLRLWDIDAGDEPLVLHGHAAAVNAAAFSPDGGRVASASDDGTVRVWRADGNGARQVLAGHAAEVRSVAFDPAGGRVVSAARDRTVRVWAVDGGGAPVVLRGHTGDVWSAAFSPDGGRVVSGSFDRTVRVWRADGSGAPLVLRGHEDAVLAVAFSPDGQRVVSASNDRTVRVWRADGSGAPLVLRGHEQGVLSASFSPDGARVVSASNDRTVRVWSAASGELLRTLPGSQAVNAAVFSPDGARIAAASGDGNIRIWAAGGDEPLVTLSGHTRAVLGVRFSADGARLVSASEDATVRVWHDLAPVSLDDPRLWTRTSHCVPIEARQELLGVSEEMARAGFERCRVIVAVSQAAAR